MGCFGVVFDRLEVAVFSFLGSSLWSTTLKTGVAVFFFVTLSFSFFVFVSCLFAFLFQLLLGFGSCHAQLSAVKLFLQRNGCVDARRIGKGHKGDAFAHVHVLVAHHTNRFDFAASLWSRVSVTVAAWARRVTAKCLRRSSSSSTNGRLPTNTERLLGTVVCVASRTLSVCSEMTLLLAAHAALASSAVANTT